MVIEELLERGKRNREIIYQLYLEGVHQGDLFMQYLDSLGFFDVAPVIVQSIFFIA